MTILKSRFFFFLFWTYLMQFLMGFYFTRFWLDGRHGNGYFWIIFIFWHSWHPLICVRSDMKQIKAIPPNQWIHLNSFGFFRILCGSINSQWHQIYTNKWCRTFQSTGGPLLTRFFEILKNQPCKQKTV